jgi:FKBP-type peptidyl-prolyl cis-trans isomerase
MISNELRESAVELNAILANCSNEVLEKIPNKFKKFLKTIESDSYEFNYDTTKKLNEQNLKISTRRIIMLVYKDFICSKEEKEEYITELQNMVREKEEKKREKYDPDNMFNNKKRSSIKPNDKDDVKPVPIKESFLKKIWNKLKECFFKK